MDKINLGSLVQATERIASLSAAQSVAERFSGIATLSAAQIALAQQMSNIVARAVRPMPEFRLPKHLFAALDVMPNLAAAFDAARFDMMPKLAALNVPRFETAPPLAPRSIWQPRRYMADQKHERTGFLGWDGRPKKR